MKKRIVVFGGSQFSEMALCDGNYETKNNKILKKLKEKYEVDNFSDSNLTSEKAIRYAEEFMKFRKYADGILALGEADIKKGNLSAFKADLVKLLGLLRKNQIRPLLVSLSNPLQSQYPDYQKVIDEIAAEEQVEYIYSGENEKDGIYKVKSEAQMRNIILSLCA